ncbi:MAG: HTH domain-containing protein [Candidatus Jordarchaeaceae archaeon]
MSEGVEQRILECLRDVYPKDLSIEELADLTHVHRNTVSKYVYSLEKQGFIKVTRKVGRAKMYQLAKG